MTTRALLFTDVVDSTHMAERLGDARSAELWAEHDKRARALLARHHGREIGRADGFFLLFDEPREAACYALAYHQVLWELGMSARAGLHVGQVVLRQNTPAEIALGATSIEVEGLATPMTARIMALAGARQTLLSRAAREAFADAPAATDFESHGHYRLKGIEDPVEIFEFGVRDFAPFAPPPDVEKAYRVVRDGDLWRPVREIPHTLPAERDVFIGRAADLRALSARLDTGARLLTVIGPGGTGKTRFVRRYGWTWLGDWPGGVYFCDLSEARSLDGIFFAVASALAVPLGKDEPNVQLGHAIAGRGRCLIILDNFEQVVQHAPATLGRWMDRAPNAAFVVTSRERLHLPGEEVFPLEPLPLEMDAIELFATRARAQEPSFVIAESNRSAVSEVVRLLDGLPLAIELAAARVRILSPAQLVERMRDRFQLLAGAHGAAARQATLRAAIDWSWDLLAPWERAAFAQCAIFEGGFTLEAAEAVLDLSPWPQAPAAMDVVQALADKSLLRSWVPAEQRRYDIEEPHFAMYLSVHEYAAEKLEASARGAKGKAEERHGRYFASFGTDEALEALSREGGVRRRRALAMELDNLVAACRRALMRKDRDTAVPTYRAAWEVISLQGPVAIGTTLGEQVRALPGLAEGQRISVFATLARALLRAGHAGEAQALLEAALSLSRDIRDPRREGMVLLGLGNLHREQGRRTQAKQCYESALAVARRAGDRSRESSARSGLGLLDREQGRREEAREHFDAALAVARDVGDRREEGIVLGSLGLLCSESGEFDAARHHLEAALVAAREVGDRGLQGATQANLAQLHNEQGRLDEGRIHLETALAIHREVGNRRLEAIALGNLGPLCMYQGRLAEAQKHFEDALTIAREVGNRRHQGFLLASRGIFRQVQGRVQDARDDFEAALAIARDVGDRRIEGIVLERLGWLLFEQGQLEEARTCYELALTHAREGRYRRLEGIVLGRIGGLIAQHGRTHEALDSLRAGEALLREVLDREELSKLLCLRGRIEATSGERDRARAALAEAESLAAAMGSGPDTELGREVEKLRAALARPPDP